MIAAIFSLLTLQAFASNNSEFLDGFFNGLRLSQTSDSGCYLAVGLTESYYNSYSEIGFFLNNTSVLLHSFKTLINQATQTVNVCKIQTLVDFIVSLLDVANMKSYQIYLATKSLKINVYYEKYSAAQTSGEHFDEGFYLGKLFSIVFQYTI